MKSAPEFEKAKKHLDNMVTASKAAIAAMEYATALDGGQCKMFLQLWMNGEFNLIRKTFNNVPDSVFFGAE